MDAWPGTFQRSGPDAMCQDTCSRLTGGLEGAESMCLAKCITRPACTPSQMPGPLMMLAVLHSYRSKPFRYTSARCNCQRSERGALACGWNRM